MTHEIILAGFGGQGVMLMGQILTYAGMIENKQVSWIPSYGPEMRGGTANCSVIVSEEPIGAPIVSEPNLVVAMNLPSLDKFEPMLQPGGILIINSSLIEQAAKRTDIKVYPVPANDIAAELGNSRTANMVIVGAIIAASKVVSDDAVLKAFAKMFAQKPELLAINEQAIHRGMEYIHR
ncbi:MULTISPECIES: 2-oxoacid:acceptor oxidoreductase family protein [Sporomusa]|jgi:2-oxoglutarate ferredoxin oxidoreductase subunit gamma|uniref:Pyruvate synthase subunit PorC n=2 Tax=Sporomusa TaxID=2375 RepID=A0ABP2C5S2_9FIRM|nr:MULTISPECIES: 2-oxoacid:acceptor oxidoreductase family protein [Sporomusa]MCM0757179.1 2-oxoacid:acceptor oxidoreductase family protein [Sporomusa sphaeroides DSM 2875]OLS58538.1 pyruvate synthase subunit PorC [Sporomusa sphaeroides DSM 2875]CVK19678.1 Pyruvate synthase subunit PorC [Sporomusa sphaeroides DSM 2875]SCM80098.1 Pyruvate/ketoisovalerate oxidoreductase, gamma subunit [uncultured Sporomusa sp.]HML34363.1 2-oxoacid:acceptor oxidoreductase family protein [Sporomusa sphaeroides]